MNNNPRSPVELRALLEELYSIDPSMRTHEDIIRKILVEFLASTPAVTIDSTFVARLRNELEEHAKTLTNSRAYTTHPFWNFLSSHSLSIGSALLVMLLILPFAYNKFSSDRSISPFFTPGIVNLEKNAFGTLTAGTSSRGTPPERSALDMGGGSNMESTPPIMQKNSAHIMPYPIPPDQAIRYQFTYTGEPITIEASELPVYRTQKNTNSGKIFFDLVRSASIGSFTFDKLQNAFVHNVTISEDRPRGYTLYLDLENQSLTMNMNWSSWPHLMRLQESSDKTPPLSLSDSEIISIIEVFAQEYNIDLSYYGTPRIMHQEPMGYAEEKMLAYVPEEVSVIYPIKIEGQTIIDEGGNETGLYVNVNLRERAVSSIGALQAPSYESTAYAVEQNQETILEALRRKQGAYGAEDTNTERTVVVTLGTPSRSLMRTWHYDALTYTSREIFVPVLVFPVTEVSDSSAYYQKQIIIPIVKDLLSGYVKAPQPMPLDAEIRPLPATEAEPAQ